MVQYNYHYSTPPTIKDWVMFIGAFIALSLYFYISVRKINYFKSPVTVCLGMVSLESKFDIYSRYGSTVQ